MGRLREQTRPQLGLNTLQDTCTVPPTIEIDESLYFSPKPPAASVVPKPSGKTINVLHLSDWHLDPRYDIGSEANCSQYLCCRPYSTNTKLHTGVSNASVPASRFGYLYCDSPPDLALSSFKSMASFFDVDDISFTIFTGDIVSHDVRTLSLSCCRPVLIKINFGRMTIS